MDLNHLNTFRVIVQTGSFAKAARQLSYSQSAITFQISQLEQELSVKLFEKTGRNMVLTQAGKMLIPYVNQVFQSVERLHCVQSDLAAFHGELSIGVGETLLCYRLPAVVDAFHRLAPNTRLHLRSMSCCDIRDALLCGELDLGVFYSDVGGLGNLTACPLGEYPIELVASPETAERFPDFITPDRQLSVSFLINEPTCIFRQIFEDYLTRRSITLADTMELWSIPTILNLVKSNLGVTCLPSFVVAEDLARGTLVRIPTEIAHGTIQAVCAHHKNKWISPAMEAFLDLCREHI